MDEQHQTKIPPPVAGDNIFCHLNMFRSFYLRKRVPTLYVSDHKQRSNWEFKVAKSFFMSAIFT